jgi:hypothetical protein
MDPTHRMLLEVTYEGFENGVLLDENIPPYRILQNLTGCV